MKKLTVFLLVLLAASFALSAAGQSEGGAAAAAEKKPGDYQVVLVVKDLNNPFFVDMKKGGEDAAAKYGVKYTCLAPDKYSVENQIRIMEDLVQQKVDGIVIVPIDGAGIVSGIERANQANIPVFNTNTVALGGKVLGFAGIDHIAIGEALGQYAVDATGGKGKIVILEGTTGASTAQDRLTGVHNIIDKYPGIEVLASTTAKYNRQIGMQVMEDLLVRYPQIDVALCMNDAMALGAKEAVKDAKRTSILIAGADALPEAITAIETGEMAATVDSNGYGQAYVSVELLIRYLLNGEMPPADTKIGTGEAVAITKSNLEKFKASKK